MVNCIKEYLVCYSNFRNLSRWEKREPELMNKLEHEALEIFVTAVTHCKFLVESYDPADWEKQNIPKKELLSLGSQKY
jgi:hypothetical protein